MYQPYTPLSSPSDQGSVGPRVSSDLCLQTQLCRLWHCIFLASGVFPLLGEAGLASWWLGAGFCPLMGGIGSWFFGVQCHAKECV